jgi:hypothetical protein
MLKVTFVIDPHHLAYNLILRYFDDTQRNNEWNKLKKELTERFGDTAGFLFFQPQQAGYGLNWVGFPANDRKNLIRDELTVIKIFEYIFKAEIFRRVLNETEEYKQKLEIDWEDSRKKVVRHLEDITGLTFDYKVTIAVLHPKLEIGSYIGSNIIEWGSQYRHNHSQAIGLAHEVLHVSTDSLSQSISEEKVHWILHSLIYLAADEELRVRLYSGERYFNSSLIKTYHPKLIRTARRILPVWQKFLNERDGSLLTVFEKACSLK